MRVRPKELRLRAEPSDNPPQALCLGGGAICAAMMDHLLEAGCRVVVLDRDRHCRAAGRCHVLGPEDRLWEEEASMLLVDDAIGSAVEILERYDVDIMVPGVPGHAAGKLAMAWCEGSLRPRGSMAVLQELEAVLSDEGTVTMDPDSGTMICTLNTGAEACPLSCAQEGPCPLTGRPRALDMDIALNEVLERLSIKGLVIRPARIGDHGVITAEQIDALRRLLEHLERGDSVAIATSCSCHAILNVFKVC